jgi:Mg-chelatase subunit ChlD
MTVTGMLVGCAGVKTGGTPGSGTGAGQVTGGSTTGPDAGGGSTTAIGTTPVFDALPEDLRARDLLSSERPLLGNTPDAACATQSASAERFPLDLYVMMDSSGSMTDPTASGVTKWDAVRAALTAFFKDPSSTGIGIGLQYFPQEQPNVPASCNTDVECGAAYGPCFRLRTCTGATFVACTTNADCARGQTCELLGLCALNDNLCAPAGAICANAGGACTSFDGYCVGRDICTVPAYATPAVPMAPLPGAAAGLIASLGTHEPDGLTPTAPALSGAIQYARQRAMTNRGRKVAVVLVTDGFPSECMPTDIPGVAGVAAMGVAGNPSVATFVIGVFAPEDAVMATMNLNALAVGGGTNQAVVISTQQDVTQMLQTALNQIRTQAVACQYLIPPPSGGAIDFNKVNVQVTSGAGAIGPSTVGYVKTKAGCDPVRGGWYYDVDPASGGTPTSIFACDASCTAFRADLTVQVDIVLGCQTVTVL